MVTVSVRGSCRRALLCCGRFGPPYSKNCRFPGLQSALWRSRVQAWRTPMTRVAAFLTVIVLLTLPAAAQDKPDRVPGRTGVTPGQSQQPPGGARDLAPGQKQTEPGGARDINPGSDVSSLRAKLEAQCVHRRRTMPPDPRDDCARKLRDARLSAGNSDASQISGIGPGSAGGQETGIGPGRGGGQGNGIGPGNGGGQAKGRR